MAVITVRDVPDDLYRLLKTLAERSHRSLQAQVLVLLEQARLSATESPVVQAQALRARLTGRELGDTVAEVREERAR